MGKTKNKKEEVILVAEFRISMHCNACESSVAKAITKIKGVEKFMTDMKNHRVIITGKINPQKVAKKLKKKTGKRVEVVEIEDANEDDSMKMDDSGFRENYTIQPTDSWMTNCDQLHMIFNDDNANSCSVM